MKVLVDVKDGGLESLLGERVIFLCGNYFYAGVLRSVNTDCIVLDEASIVFETGTFKEASWPTAQKIDGQVFVMKHAIEAGFQSKK